MERGGSSNKSKPYHECPFCKQGFTTAQAKGGHMNIHRGDRANGRPGRDAPAAGTASAPATGSGFATHYAVPSAAADAMSQRELSLFGADLRLGPGSSGVPDEREQPAGDAERSLDLELRLGRHPGWQ